ncbi:MAG: F0F1 ATP synthase subunit A [Candidatus Woesebacteria bacterium]|jgi:F-type H+-transporting ATPase subunit a
MQNYFASSGPHVSLTPDTLFHIGPLPITNTILLGILGYAIVLGIFFATARLIKKGSRSLFMYAVMWLFEILFGTIVDVMGSREKAKKIAPLAVTLFVLILVNNWLGLLPFVGSSVTYNGVPLFRGLAADLNVTFALAIVSMVTVQIWAIRALGPWGNVKRYVSSVDGPLEFIAEFSRLTALSMRLFGNVFGGEVLLAVIGYLTQYAAPLGLPVFMLLELFVGAVQAYVFFMLTVVFVSLGSSHGDHAQHEDIETNSPAAVKQTAGS